MNATQVVRAAIPDADGDLVDHILFGRTPFPCGAIDARRLYKAADQWRRAGLRGRVLCDHCSNIAMPGTWNCRSCYEALTGAAFQNTPSAHNHPSVGNDNTQPQSP